MREDVERERRTQETTLAISTTEIAEALGITPRAVQKRAASEGWNHSGSGKWEFRLDELPAEIQGAYLRSLRLPTGSSMGHDKIEGFDQLKDKEKAEVRRWLKILADWKAYAAQSRRRTRTKARRDFCLSYRISHPTEKVFSPSTLKNKEKKLQQEGLTALASSYGKTQNFASWPDEAKAFLRQLYLHENQPTMRWCIRQLRLEGEKQKWQFPSDETLRRFLSRIPQEMRDFYRKGERFWRQNYLPSVLRDYDSLRPGEVYVADHRCLDIACRFADGRIGRPWMTGVLDMGSRMLLGWHLDVTPSVATILLALYHAFNDYGLCEHALFDNGRDFSARLLSGGTRRFRLHADEEEISGLLLQLEIKVSFALPGNARSKIIERWFRDMGDFEKGWATYLGNNVSARPETVDARIKKGVDVPTLENVHDALKNFIADKNQNLRHRGHGMSGMIPLEIWNGHFAKHAVRRAALGSLRALLMKGGFRKVSRFGIAVLNSLYRADELAGMVGQQIVYRYDPLNLGRIHVYGVDGAFLCEAVKWVRTAWNDESDLVRLKRFEKQRKRAIKAEMEAAREIFKIEAGYRPVPVSTEATTKEKVVRICRTPLDGVPLKLGEDDESAEPSTSPVREALRRRFGTLTSNERSDDKSFTLLHGGTRQRKGKP